MHDGEDMALDRRIAELRAFEAGIARRFNAGEIRAPVHLSDGGEAELIEIFRDIAPRDWVCSTWRSHYHCLLKGVPPAELEAEIVSGRSIALQFPAHRVVTSAIAGGIVPIALGIAMGERLKASGARVWCFVGDMVARSGIFYEAANYALGHEIPIRFVVEDNSLSVCTPTEAVWRGHRPPNYPNIRSYRYESRYPHAGAGVRVNF